MRPPKTLDEIKSTLLARAGRGNPVRGLSREEVEAVVARLQSVDPDHWAKVWSGPAEPWLAKAKEAEKSGGNEGARESYLKAYAYFAAARYPALFSPEMEQAYGRARDAYQKASRYFDPPLEVVRIPFEKKEIVGYLRLRSGEGKQPLVFHWGGIDGWKEERQGNTEALIQAGFGLSASTDPAQVNVQYRPRPPQRGFSQLQSIIWCSIPKSTRKGSPWLTLASVATGPPR